jgi:hypothetical protein
MLRIAETTNGYVCGPHDTKVTLMIAPVSFPAGCEECTRMAFAEALERTLAARVIAKTIIRSSRSEGT